MTEGCIAIGNLDYWEGILIPCDAQPDRAGLELRIYLKYHKDLQDFKAKLLQHMTWASFRAEYVGSKNTFFGMDSKLITKHHADPLFKRYIYVVDIEERQLHCLEATFEGGGATGYECAETIDLDQDNPPVYRTWDKKVLDLKFEETDEGFRYGPTIGAYLIELLKTLWIEQQNFSGKRPFGNGGWDYDLYTVLIRNGIIEGKLDEWGYIETFDNEKGFEVILRAIQYLGKGD